MNGGVTYLTPEAEVLHFGFKVPDIGNLRPILTVENHKNTSFIKSLLFGKDRILGVSPPQLLLVAK